MSLSMQKREVFDNLKALIVSYLFHKHHITSTTYFKTQNKDCLESYVNLGKKIFLSFILLN